MSVDGALGDVNPLDVVLEIAAKFMLKGATAQDISDWAVRSLASLLWWPGMDDGLDELAGLAQAAEDPSFCALLGRAIHAAMPLPSRRFRPVKLELPERNDPCCCGSGRKFKLCCGPMAAHMPRFLPEVCAAPMLRAMSQREWATLPAQGMPLALAGAVAHDWYGAGLAEDAVRLLEPWVPKEGSIGDDMAELLDLLGDCYADVGKPRKRKALAQALIDRGSPLCQSKGWQRLALMACDAGKYGEARQAFQNAMRMAPNDPSLGVLELSLLIGEGQTTRLPERADFWARKLQQRNQDGQYNDLIEMVREMGQSGPGMLTDTMLARAPDLRLVADWLKTLPAPQLALSFGPRITAQDLGALTPTPVLRKALSLWEQAFQPAEPSLTQLCHGSLHSWALYEDWVPVLHQHPVLASSFDVLDALVMALFEHPSPAGVRLAEQVLARAMTLWASLRQRYPHARCEWAHLDNRPALRLLVQHIAQDDSPDAAVCFDWLRHTVEVLNPHDNHGLRMRLMEVYLRRGQADAALHLVQRFPDDFHAMQMLHARALWAVGQVDEAQGMMREVFTCAPHFAKAWCASKAPPASDAPYVRYGSPEEARSAYRQQFDLWQEPALRKQVLALTKAQ